jgi:molybdopterin converting factor small subunit
MIKVKETHVRVKIFGAPSLTLESREVEVKLGQDATGQDLLDALPIDNKDYLYIVRDGIRLTSSSKLHDGDEIMIIPPIAGGFCK